MTRLRQWLQPASGAGSTTEASPVPSLQPDPASTGCPGYSIGTGAILQHHQTLIVQLNQQLNLPEPLQSIFNETLDNLISWFHLLPAHPQHHCEAGGAVRHALEIALWSVSAMQQSYPDHSLNPGQRRQREPLWRLIAGVSGLLYDTGRMIACLKVCDHDTESRKNSEVCQWLPDQQGLSSWLQQHRINHYHPYWHQCDSQPDTPPSPEYLANNLLLLPRLVPTGLQHVLQPLKDHGLLWQHFIQSLTGSGSQTGRSTLSNHLELARLKSIKLHFVRGEALDQVIPPPSSGTEPKNREQASCWLKTVIRNERHRPPRWMNGCLLLTWPPTVNNSLPSSEMLIDVWLQLGWLRTIKGKPVFERNNQPVIALKPDISDKCRPWLRATEQPHDQ